MTQGSGIVKDLRVFAGGTCRAFPCTFTTSRDERGVIFPVFVGQIWREAKKKEGEKGKEKQGKTIQVRQGTGR